MVSVVQALRVEGLFDKYDYEIALSDGADQREERLRLIYGSNGSGKSTVLRLLFHTLSAIPDRGHFRALARLPFADFTVQLSDAQVRVERVVVDDTPQLTIAVRSQDDVEVTCHYGADEVRQGRVQIDELRQVQQRIWQLGINPVILTDSRQIVSDLLPETTRARQPSRVEYLQAGSSAVDELVNEQRDADLARALQQVQNYLGRLTLAGSQEGSSRIDTIYAEVADGIADHPVPRGRPAQHVLPMLASRVRRVGSRAEAYTRYGLLQEFPQERLLAAIDRAAVKTGPTLTSLLTPYLDSSEKRLEALSPALTAIDRYVTTVNSFFDNKFLKYSPGAGLTVVDEQLKTDIDPAGLSSGEKHLLLLFSYLMALRDRTRLIIIDEPEISLNPDWQRTLVPRLLNCLEDTEAHLLLATHSIEILAPHQENVRRLVERRTDAD